MATNTRKLASLLGASGAGIANNGTLNSSAIGADVIVAEDIANNAITVAELQDNAVTNIKLADEGTLTQSAIKRSIHKAWVMGG